MSSRRNFLDADNSLMEKNLRFVKNDLEENLNQYFGGSSMCGSNSTKFSVPPRDYKVVQPEPDGSHAHSQSNDLEERREFLLQLGLARHDAYNLAKSSYFDVKRLENMYQQYFARGYRQDEVMKRILSDVRNDNNWAQDIIREEQSESRKEPVISARYNEQQNSNVGHREYNKGFRDRSRSRSRSRSYNAYRADQPSQPYREDEYIPQHVYNRDNERREIFSEQSVSLMKDDNHKLRSHYPDRDISPMRYRREESYMSQQRRFRNETERTNTHVERSRSYSPGNNREHFALRSHSPKNMINDYPNRPFSPFRGEIMEARFVSSRSRSSSRGINEGYCSYNHSPTRMERRDVRFRLSRSRSPNRRMNEDHRLYSPTRYDNREERFQLSRFPKKLSSPRREQNDIINRLSGKVKYSAVSSSPMHDMHDSKGSYHRTSREKSSPMHDCKGNYHRTSMEKYSPEFYSQQDNLRHKNYEQLRSRDFSPPRNNPSTHDRDIPSLVTLNVHPENIQHSKTNSQSQNVSSRNSFPSELYNRKQNYPQTSRESRTEEFYEHHDKSSHTEYEQHGSRKRLSSKNNPPFRGPNVPSLLELNIFPEKEQNFEACSHFRTSSSYVIEKDRMQNYLQSSKEKRLDSFYLKDVFKQSHSPNFSQPRKMQTSTDGFVSSLLPVSVNPERKQQSETSLRNRDISSLHSLQFAPNINNMEQQTISKQPVIYSHLSNEGIKKIDTNKGNVQIKQTNVDKNENNLKKNIANVPVIHSGLAKPLPGFLKANPRDYWSKWWPSYKYIEYSVPKINPNDHDVKSCLYYLLNPNTAAARSHKLMLIEKSITTIMRTEDVNETNYFTQDIFKLFQYKQHLEDPNFQNSLTPAELNCIAPALRQFKIRTIMAFMHQALIVKWHLSLEIMKKVIAGQPIKSNYARNLLNNKSFHYLVMVSIQELKKMCQQDWPQFTEFYKTIRAKRVDIYTFGVGPQRSFKN